MRSRLLRPEWMLPAESGFLAQVLPDCILPEEAGTLSQVMYWEATANLTGDMLVKVDRMSMANSLEVRSPLLDHELAELAATIPHDWKIAGGRGKRILLDALGDRLPPALLNRPKWGFGVPLADWFRGSLREFLRDHVTAAPFLDRGIVSPEFLHALLDEHDSGRRDNSHWLWSLLVLSLWLEEIGQVELQPVPDLGMSTCQVLIPICGAATPGCSAETRLGALAPFPCARPSVVFRALHQPRFDRIVLDIGGNSVPLVCTAHPVGYGRPNSHRNEGAPRRSRRGRHECPAPQTPPRSRLS